MYKLKFNWLSLLLITNFYVYGYFGYGVAKYSKNNFAICLILILYLMVLLTLFIQKEYFVKFNDAITLTIKDLITFICFLCIITLFARNYLQQFQTRDELSFLGSGFQYQLKLLSFLNFFPEKIHVNNLIHLISFFILAFNIICVVLFLKLEYRKQIIVVGLATITFQLLLSISGANLIGYF